MSDLNKIVFLKVDANVERLPMHLALAENNYGAELLIEDYGVKTGEPGYAGIIHIERDHNTGHLTLYLWADITEEEPTHVISLEQAREKYREPGNE